MKVGVVQLAAGGGGGGRVRLEASELSSSDLEAFQHRNSDVVDVLGDSMTHHHHHTHYVAIASVRMIMVRVLIGIVMTPRKESWEGVVDDTNYAVLIRWSWWR